MTLRLGQGNRCIDGLAASCIALTGLARNVRVAHVFVESVDAGVKAACWQALDAKFFAGLGTVGAELGDGPHLITHVAPEGPAAEAG
jgi:hypothetical protein